MNNGLMLIMIDAMTLLSIVIVNRNPLTNTVSMEKAK